MEEEKSDKTEKKAGAAEGTPAEKPKKQPKVWVKPGSGAPAPAPTAAPGAVEKAAAQASGTASTAPAGEAAPAQKAAPGPPARKAAKAEAPTYLDIGQDSLVLRLQEHFPGVVLAAQSFLNQKILTLDASKILPVCEFLKDDPECGYDLLEDVTAVDYPEREKRFVVTYQLCSISHNVQLRLKCNIAENEEIASVCPVWPAANWLEREVFDMFGIVFAGHPDLRRILLPEDWVGYPLRKDYDLRKQDEDWIRRHLQIRK
ncbi:MAG: NADH-quinone oxidoreductase subunit C [Acidobacteria bacterium]|nr:NADH-quinone oxidoreductase subunit C [Acidobacteriota bacterium]